MTITNGKIQAPGMSGFVRRLFICLMAFVSASAFASSRSTAHTYKPPEGYVATADVAIKIAEAVLKPIYGDKAMNAEKPLRATLTKDNVWVVTGTLQPNRKGGVAEIWIDKQSGTILKVTHGQ